MKLTTDIFSEFDQVWALVTAGTPDNFNTMTISWGGMGTRNGHDRYLFSQRPFFHLFPFSRRLI